MYVMYNAVITCSTWKDAHFQQKETNLLLEMHFDLMNHVKKC